MGVLAGAPPQFRLRVSVEVAGLQGSDVGVS